MAGLETGFSKPLRLAKGLVIPSWDATVGILAKAFPALAAAYLATSIALPPPSPATTSTLSLPASSATASASSMEGALTTL